MSDPADLVEPAVKDPATKALVREMVRRVADRWTWRVLDLLWDGDARFGQIQESIGVSQKVLTQTLRQLERDGFVTRSAHLTVPPRVDYSLTDLGRTLTEAFCGVWMWAEEHQTQVEAARARFDGAGEPASRD
jgi:DNA-binding HxlR family transcriptional regulator